MLTAAVQAGGRSSRMGQDKALLRLGGVPLIQRLLERIRGLCDELLVTTNRPRDYAFLGVRLVADEIPDAGALYGLRTALKAARGDRVLVLACDMPFVSRALLAHMLAVAPQADLVVPSWGGMFEPFQAVYARSCLEYVEAALDAGERRVTSFYSRARVLRIEEPELSSLDPEGLSFFNINTPEDLARAEEILEKTQPDI